MLDLLYVYVKTVAQSPHAEASLGAVAFAESSSFPVPRGALNRFGEPLREAMKGSFTALPGGFAALVVVGFIIAVRAF